MEGRWEILILPWLSENNPGGRTQIQLDRGTGTHWTSDGMDAGHTHLLSILPYLIPQFCKRFHDQIFKFIIIFCKIIRWTQQAQECLWICHMSLGSPAAFLLSS